uniref:Uncharacterized Fusion Protein n=1 Tax=Aquifex aeolicus (strain VF5) TaxID=224324 RepID=UPI0006891DAA|nr:Chain A, Uncharacterized Fusion Protein [synthetic construct]4ZSZ_B Chain B, Uncharacterized Fusion Protein [synthetic construct]
MVKYEELLKTLENGINSEEGEIRLVRKSQGRFKEEFNFDLSLGSKPLLTLKVFLGRKPYWQPWVEVFGVNPNLRNVFFGSEAERKLYEFLSEHFGRIFVEYFEDKETTYELQKGVPPALSRLGFELLKLGYTYFRDWFIPEGLMEGGHKIQAEKPKTAEAKARHLANLKKEFEEFIGKCEDEGLIKKVKERYNFLEEEIYERCRLAAHHCIHACERYLALCTESSREQRQHAGDCADLCRLAALLLERRSPWAPAACELAARYALACAERCDGDEPLERECAGACRRFVAACHPLL